LVAVAAVAAAAGLGCASARRVRKTAALSADIPATAAMAIKVRFALIIILT
jgi:hypothetical protein